MTDAAPDHAIPPLVVSSSMLADVVDRARAAVEEIASTDRHCSRRWDSGMPETIARTGDERLELTALAPMRGIPRAMLTWWRRGAATGRVSFPCALGAAPRDPDLLCTRDHLLAHLRAVAADVLPALDHDAAFGSTVSALAPATREFMATATACAMSIGRHGPSSNGVPLMRLAFPSPWSAPMLLDAFDGEGRDVPPWVGDALAAASTGLPRFAARASGGSQIDFDVVIQPYVAPLPPMGVVEAMRRIARVAP